MKLSTTIVRGLSFVAATFFFTTTAGGVEHFDPELKDWLKEPTTQTNRTTTKDVLVFFYKESPRDHAQLPKLIRIQESKSIALETIHDNLWKVDRLLPQGVRSHAEVYWSAHAAKIPVTKRALKKLKRVRSIEAIVADSVVQLDTPMADDGRVETDESQMTYGLQLIKASAAWDRGLSGQGVRVGILDTGIDLQHPDLEGKTVEHRNFTKDADIYDAHGHGTHVAGTIAGGDASGIKIGVAPEAELIVAKVFDRKGRATKSGLIKAMEWMIDPDGNPETDDAPRVVSNSWGNSSQFEFGFRHSVKAWREAQIFPNFAAGNSGFYLSVGAPARYPYAYAVGAMDEFANVTSFSSKGPSIWWGTWFFTLHTKPEISAPGHYTYSAVPGAKWKRYSGTSMATPHVSGVIALALEANPDLSVEDLMEILNSSALDHGAKGMDNRSGYGLIQTDKVIEKALRWKEKSHSYSQDRDRNPLGWQGH